MSNKNDGGPAFPQNGWTKDPETLKRMQESGMGMTLRDWFAGQALAGLLACPEVTGSEHTLPKSAYNYADAMLKAMETK